MHIVGAEAIRSLNAQHRGVDAETDVLSFPVDGAEPLADGVPRQLGDIFVCLEYVERQLMTGDTISGRPDESLLEALEHCVVHGSLHLLGMDHDSDAREREMLSRESTLLAELRKGEAE